jgi:nucleotide-binding universal stress UspA family protein
MYKTIMWATDGSEGADAALEAALRLAELSGARVIAVHCDQRLTGRAAAWPTAADEEDRRIKIRRQVAHVHAKGIDIELIVRRSHHEAADVVAAMAAELAADVLICGTRGRGALAGAFLGSFTHRLLHIAPCPVLAVREPVGIAAATEPEKAEVGA